MPREPDRTSPLGGLIRGSRTPDDWVAPGPPPAPESAWAPHLPRAQEDLCHLTGSWRILQRTDGHRYSLDDSATAWVAGRLGRRREVRTHVDLGCGIGSVLLMVAWQLPEARCRGVEAQDVSFDLACRSTAINGVTDRVSIDHQDLRQAELSPTHELVTGTPPYLPLGTATVSEAIQKDACRHELRGGVEDYCLAAARALALTGRFVVCQAAADQHRIDDGARQAGLAVLERMDVIPKEGRAPLFAVWTLCRSDAPDRPDGPMVHAEPLTVRDARGKRTDGYLTMRRDLGMP